MSIGKRIFLYSFGVVSLVGLLILAYFTLMLSPLYAQQIELNRLSSLKTIQKAQLSQDEQTVTQALKGFDTPTSVFAMTLPKNQDRLTVNSVFKIFDVSLNDRELQALYQEGVSLMNQLEGLSEKQAKAQVTDFAKKAKQVLNAKSITQSWPEEVISLTDRGTGIASQQIFNKDSQSRYHGITDQQFIMEMKITDETTAYTTYFGVTVAEEAYYVVVAATLTPKMTELNEVIGNSLPTILLVLLVIVLIATLLFSRVLIKPLNSVSQKMKAMKEGNYDLPPLAEAVAKPAKLDEYQQLEDDLIALYRELEQQRAYLLEQNQKQKIFLTASSHQLKTPVTAALLLVDGMLGEVGKYKETKTYLPELKIKLIEMQQIVNDILLIDQQLTRPIQRQQLELAPLIISLVNKHHLLLEERGQQVVVAIEPGQFIESDLLYVEKVIDNLLLNGINYSPLGAVITISGNSHELQIENNGVQIPEEYLTKLFDPFVRPSQTTKGHGLGLYLVAQYGQLLGFEITIRNQPGTNSVVATLTFQ